MTIAIVDYQSGNLHSAQKAFERVAAEQGAGPVVVTSDPDVVAKADRIVLPGDGAFPACRAALFDKSGLFEAMEQAVHNGGRPFLGICIGMQMMATQGLEYETTRGFDWIGGEVVPIEPADTALKVPHMGWNDLVVEQRHPVLSGIQSGTHAYFVHSFHMQVTDLRHRLAYVEYGQKITAIIGRDNMVGMQFHPEKSQEMGLHLIANFLNWTP